MTKDVTSNSVLKLLCITAHPDDEAGAVGGTLALYSSSGVETHIICLTPGQAATHRGAARSDDELSRIRRSEFDASCTILGVAHGEVLSYPDGGLHRVSVDEIVGGLVKAIRCIRPHVVVTLGLEGTVTAHPDHSMAAAFATLAYHWAGRGNRYAQQLSADGQRPHCTPKLFYVTSVFTLPGREPVSLAPVTTTIDISTTLEKKINAFRAHLTQAPLIPIFEKAVRDHGPREYFHLAATTVPPALEAEDDLFAGIAGD